MILMRADHTITIRMTMGGSDGRGEDLEVVEEEVFMTVKILREILTSLTKERLQANPI